MVTVRVPATSANLACGFDTLGIAYKMYNTLSFALSDTLSFSGCPEEFRNEDNLAWLAFKAVYEHIGKPVPTVHIDIRADVPVCRGLGSSAALIAGGAVGANELSGAKLSRDELLAVVTPIEGHPDNLAPALLGGMTASVMDNGAVFSVAYPVNPALFFTVLFPDYTLSTHLSRGALPKSVPYGDAVFNLSRLSVLPKAMELGDEELIARALTDKLHQPYRRPLIHGYDEVDRCANELGCRAVCISGAGPSILCVSRDKDFAAKMREKVAFLPHNWTVLDLTVDPEGAKVI